MDAIREGARCDGGSIRDGDTQAAATHGLKAERDPLQMFVPLPVDEAVPPIALCSFAPGEDEAAWSRSTTVRRPSSRVVGPAGRRGSRGRAMVDPAGFLLHHDPTLAPQASWTKVHDDESPRLGEIYVIAVDPDFGGRKLGRTLTLAALDWMHRTRGIDRGMLYVDAANGPAVRLYTSIGFTVDHTDRAYAGSV
jgi:mycothiol synthase